MKIHNFLNICLSKKVLVYIFVTTLLLFLWLAIFFIGYLLASDWRYLVFSFGCAILIFLTCKKISFKYAVTVSCITLAFVGLSIYFGFEESYCWKQGELQDPKGDKFATATQEDAEALKGFNVMAGEQIGVGFRTHMLCHKTFNFFNRN